MAWLPLVVDAAGQREHISRSFNGRAGGRPGNLPL